MMVQMSIAPIEAQKRAVNLSMAESLAVTYAANNEGKEDMDPAPAGCVLDALANNAGEITCTSGTGKYVQTVSRSFRLFDVSAINTDTGSGNGRTFQYDTPARYSGHQCPNHDQWGVYGYNDDNREHLNGDCIPRALWNRNKYLASNPDNWLYDANNFQGWGDHPDY